MSNEPMNDILPDDADDAPLLDERFFANAGLRINGVVVREATDTQLGRGRPPKRGAAKVQQSLRLSPDILAWFRAGGDGWQARIDDALRLHMETMTPRDAAAR